MGQGSPPPPRSPSGDVMLVNPSQRIPPTLPPCPELHLFDNSPRRISVACSVPPCPLWPPPPFPLTQHSSFSPQMQPAPVFVWGDSCILLSSPLALNGWFPRNGEPLLHHQQPATESLFAQSIPPSRETAGLSLGLGRKASMSFSEAFRQGV